MDSDEYRDSKQQFNGSAKFLVLNVKVPTENDSGIRMPDFAMAVTNLVLSRRCKRDPNQLFRERVRKAAIPSKETLLVVANGLVISVPGLEGLANATFLWGLRSLRWKP